MTDILFANNASTTLASAITNTQTSITLTSGGGALFPSPSGSQFFTLTLISASDSTIFEIVYCTARSGDTLTIVRGEEGTTALAFNAGDLAQGLLTAGALNALIAGLAPLASPTFTGAPAAPTPAGTDSSAKLATTAFLAAAFIAMQSLGGNGFQKFPGGLTIQWGTVSVPGVGGVVWNYPTAFSIQCYGIVGMCNSVSGTPGPVSPLAASGINTVNAQIDFQSTSDNFSVFLIAIGR